MTFNILQKKNVCYDNNRKSVKIIFPNNDKKEGIEKYNQNKLVKNNTNFINNEDLDYEESNISQESTRVFHGIESANNLF